MIRRTPRQRRFAAIASVSAAVVMAGAGTAHAATTVGQTGTPTSCGANFIVAQLLTAGEPTYFIPSDGVITSWSAASNSAGTQVKLLVLERVTTGPPLVVRIAAKSDFGSFPSAGTHSFPAQIPVTRGQEIGAYGYACVHTSPGDVASNQGPMAEPAIGQQETLTSTGGNLRAAVSAVLEPDCDSDGLGDETQDPGLIGGTCPRRTLSLNTNKRNVKKGKKVTLSGQVTQLGRQGAECLANQPVELLRKKPSQNDFKVFATVQSDAQGQFSLKKKVKKTTEFLARLQLTTSCVAVDSEVEKVKVKK